MDERDGESYQEGGQGMATYPEIIEWVYQKHRQKIHKTCYIAHCKELAGLNPRRAPNRKGNRRDYHCPDKLREPIFEALKHFGMIPDIPDDTRIRVPLR